MTSGVDMLNIPADILNISPTSSTSPRCAIALPAGSPPKASLEDVEDVEPKKFIRSTYLLSVIARGSFLRLSVSPSEGPTSTRTYLGLNILNIPKTWHATSHSVLVARALNDLAARRREAIARLTRAHHTSPLTRKEKP